MSPQLDSPIQTQMAVSVLKNTLVLECHGSQRVEEKQPFGRRRVFVQTETGCLLGLELDRCDNAHTVKRKMQLVLNIPTRESSLTFGDMVLDDDLSAIQKDSSLLLTRNQMHRSSSTPCLSPSGREIQHGDSTDSPIEILGHSKCFDSTRQIVRDIVKAIKHGVDPLPVKHGLGGAYYFKNIRGENVAVVKPTDEEPFAPNNPKGFVGMSLGQPGLKHSVRVGEAGVREVAAYLLDHAHFADVPATALVKVTHSIFNVNRANGNKTGKKELVCKIASLQQFIQHDFDASDHGTSSFPVSAVHRIGILDVRIFNTDRHGGNLLVRKPKGASMFGLVELIPIDHGLCLPENLEDPYFEWMHWPQASIPFSEDELDYIKNLDPVQDCKMLRKELPMIREACLRVLVLCTVFLKEAAFYGLCLAEIGEMMTREFRNEYEEPSELEVVCFEARRLVEAEREQALSPRTPVGGEEFLFDIEYEDLGWDFTLKTARTDFSTGSPFSVGNGSAKTRLCRLEESAEEDENEGNEISGAKSFGSTGLGDKIQKGKWNAWIGHRSADEQLPSSPCFVKLADMADEEWGAFLVKFKELLTPAFSKLAGQRLRQRLGTSCKF